MSRARGLPAMLAVLAAAVSPVPAPAVSVAVHDESGFAAAAARFRTSGGTIVLRRGLYADLSIGPRGPGRLVVRAGPGAQVKRLLLHGTRDVRLTGLRIAPAGGPARLYVWGSRGVGFERLAVTGTSAWRANASVVRSARVRFVGGAFARCGEGKPPDAGYCIRLVDTAGVTIASSRFRDCFGCDFVHGLRNSGLTIRGSSFRRARVGRCGHSVVRCPHVDLVQLAGGRDVVIDRNRFGVYERPGAAQVYLTGGIRRVRVTNNLFLASDAQLPAVHPPTGLWVGNRVADDVPRRVVIENNTILSGRPRLLPHDAGATTTSILLSPLYGTRIALDERPVVANNVLAFVDRGAYKCAQVRISVANVVRTGPRCSASDQVGDPSLDRTGRPTAASTLVIDRADRGYATWRDIEGSPRGPRPDVGAFEYSD
jgi:hypothetical protein